jgi:S1-C subfamily serine protease
VKYLFLLLFFTSCTVSKQVPLVARILAKKAIASAIPLYHSKGNTIYVTAKHAIDVKIKTVTLYSAENKYTATVIKRAPKNDICFISIPYIVPTFSLDLRIPKKYQRVYAIGCTNGYAPLISEGVVSRSVSPNTRDFYWICSAPIYKGNSGGAVIDRGSRKVIGMSISMFYTEGLFGQHPMYFAHGFVLSKRIHKVYTAK